MKKWEYEILAYDGKVFNWWGKCVEEMNQLGEEGLELINTHSNTQSAMFIFRREKKS